MTTSNLIREYDRTQQVLTLDQYRDTLKVTQEKTGKGEKQIDIWYIRDKDDPTGAKGTQSTVTAKDAVEWHIGRSYVGYLQSLHNLGRLTHAQAQSHTDQRIHNQEDHPHWRLGWYVIPEQISSN